MSFTWIPSPRATGSSKSNPTQVAPERILAEADGCTERGQIGELLRREGIYSSQLNDWHKQRAAHGQTGLQAQRPGPKPTRTADERRVAQLERKAPSPEPNQLRAFRWSFGGDSTL